MSNQFITTRPQWLLLRPFAMRGIYLSGPISADLETAPERFQKARDFIAEVFGPDQPIATPIGITLDNPDVPSSIIDPGRYKHPLYMIECYKFLMACNCIALLPGWEQSEGAVYEARFAESLGIIPLFLFPLDFGADLSLDLEATFRAVADERWVDDWLERDAEGRLSLAVYEQRHGLFDSPLSQGDVDWPYRTVNPVPVGSDPNPSGAPVDGAVAQAIADRTAMELNTAGFADGCPHDHIAP